MVYNAAIIRADGPGDLSVDELAETWSVNVAGVLVAAMATIPAMQERGGGTFLVTGGMPRPVANRLSLSLGKAGSRALTSMLAEHFGPLVCTSPPSPSPTRSPRTRRSTRT